MRASQILGVLGSVITALPAAAANYPMTLHQVEDPTGIHGVAYRYLAPRGWKVNAQLAWTDNIVQPTVLAASADSPDGRFGYSFLPGIDFMFGGTTGGMSINARIKGLQTGIAPPNRLTDTLMDLLEKAHLGSDLKATQREDHPLTAAQLGSQRNFGEVSALAFRFIRNGQPMEGVMFARMDGFLAGNPRADFQAYNGDWQVSNAFMVYYPKGEGKKGMRFFSLAVPTYTATPAFVKARGAWILVLNHQIDESIRQAGEISRITAKLSREREDAIMGRYHSQMAAQNKAISGFCDYIGDIDRYQSKDGEVQLASGYKDAWTNGKGDYVLSDNIGYDPNQGSGGGWSRLQKVK